MLWNIDMKRIDANVILRYLLDDHEELSAKAVGIIDHEYVHASTEVICEVVYVLGGVYKVSRKQLSALLLLFLQLKHITTDDFAVLKVALSTFAEKKIDFVDTILYAHHVVHGDLIATFDKRLSKMTQCAG